MSDPVEGMLMAPRLNEIRQPRANDVVGQTLTIAGYGSGFEGVVVWNVQDANGQSLGSGHVQGVGSMGVIRDFGHQVSLNPSGARGGHVVLQVFGSDPSGQHPPGPDLNQVRVTLFDQLDGWKLYEVKGGDNLTTIAEQQGQNTTANDVFEANRDIVINPNLIFPGQVLRIPLLV